MPHIIQKNGPAITKKTGIPIEKHGPAVKKKQKNKLQIEMSEEDVVSDEYSCRLTRPCWRTNQEHRLWEGIYLKDITFAIFFPPNVRILLPDAFLFLAENLFQKSTCCRWKKNKKKKQSWLLKKKKKKTAKKHATAKGRILLSGTVFDSGLQSNAFLLLSSV